MRPSRETPAGRAYLDLQAKARRDRRPTDELLRLYVLEAFLDRLSRSAHRDRFALKGGVLLAAYGARRATRDIDLHAYRLANDTELVLGIICEIAGVVIDDGVAFQPDTARAVVIREEDAYSGVRVSIDASLATARLPFHVDVSSGDAIWPAPRHVRLPRLLAGDILLPGYPLSGVIAEKTVTAITRGITSTRWRDFADIYIISRIHPVAGDELGRSIRTVAEHRGVALEPLATALAGFAETGQDQWSVWRRRQQLDDRLPPSFADVLAETARFLDPAVLGVVDGDRWDPAAGRWA